MKKCKGIFGWLFGHRFVSRIIEYIPMSGSGETKISADACDVLNSLAHKKYIVICKRCGIKNG